MQMRSVLLEKEEMKTYKVYAEVTEMKVFTVVCDDDVIPNNDNLFELDIVDEYEQHTIDWSISRIKEES